MSESVSVLDFNLDLQFFLQRFQNYKNSVNVVDKDTISLMITIVKDIDTFLDKARVIENKKNVSNTFDFAKHKLYMCNPFVNCKICKMQIHPSFREIESHIKMKKHIQLLANSNNEKIVVSIDNLKLRDNHKTSIPKQPENTTTAIYRKLNRSLKRFLEGDFMKVTTQLIDDGEKLIHLDKYDTLHDNLTRKLKPKYPNAKIYFFGSRITGLGNETTDLDVFIDVNNKFYNSYSPNTKKIDVIRNIKSILLNDNKNEEWVNVVERLKARTPILKAFNSLIAIDCDFSFTNGLSHCNTQLVKYMLDLQPVCKYIAMFIKTWVKMTGMCNMRSYVLIMMVIFFLQTKQLLPSVKTLQDDLVKPHLIGEWHADIVEKTLNDLKIPRCNDFTNNLIDFFHYYGYNFNYKEHTISPFTGNIIEKTKFQFKNLNSLPLLSYQNYVKTLNLKMVDCEKDLFAYNRPLCVQDPYELIHNIGKGVNQNELDIFVGYCRTSETVLRQQYRTQKK